MFQALQIQYLIDLRRTVLQALILQALILQALQVQYCISSPIVYKNRCRRYEEAINCDTVKLQQSELVPAPADTARLQTESAPTSPRYCIVNDLCPTV